MPLMECTTKIIAKGKKLNLLDWEAREVMAIVRSIQRLKEPQSTFLSFILDEIVKELSKDVP